MLWVPQKGTFRKEHNLGAVGAGQYGTSVTTGGATSTKGTAVQLIASTAFETYFVTVIANNYGLAAAAADGCLDILIGAATEKVLIADLLIGNCGGDTGAAMQGPKVWHFPLYIPGGTRVAAQAAGRRISTAFGVGIILYGGIGYPPFKVATKVVTYGIATVPNGQVISPGISAAEGAWAQITASTTENHFGLVPSFQVTNDATMNNKRFQVDIGIGAAAAEQEIGSEYYETSAQETMSNWGCLPTMQDIPSGTRLSMRASCNSGTLDAGYDGVIHALSV